MRRGQKFGSFDPVITNSLAPSVDGVAFLAVPTYKWMCAGPGLGLLYCSVGILTRFPSVAPFAGWFGQEVDVR